MPGVGDILPVSLKLFDVDTAQVIRATIRDKNGAEIQGSPFTLVHQGLGLYQINTVQMPDTDFVTVSYEVFSGPGFTNKNPKYQDSAKSFIKDTIEAGISDIKIRVTNKLIAEIDDTAGLSAEIVDGDSELTATIDNRQ